MRNRMIEEHNLGKVDKKKKRVNSIDYVVERERE